VTHTGSKQKAWLFLILTNLFWAGNYLFGKYVIVEVSPLWITLSRWFLALFLLWPLALWREKPDVRQLRQSWGVLLLLGLLGLCGYNLLLYAALFYTSATNAALVSALSPATIALFSACLLRERLSVAKLGGLLLSVVGVLFIITDGNLLLIFQTSYNRGDLLMLASVLVWTIYSILGKKTGSIPPITATAASATLSVLVMLPLAWFDPLDLAHISTLALSGILYMAVFPSVGSYMLWNVALRTVSASQAGVSINLIPVFTVLFGFVLGEDVTLAQIVGGLLVFLGVSMTTGLLGQRRQKKASVEG